MGRRLQKGLDFPTKACRRDVKRRPLPVSGVVHEVLHGLCVDLVYHTLCQNHKKFAAYDLSGKIVAATSRPV